MEPKYRGQDLGLVAVYTLIDALKDRCASVALKPFPPQFSNYRCEDCVPPDGVDVSDKERGFQEALSKLQAYRGRLGFRPMD